VEIKIETSHQQIDRKERGLMKSDGVDIALNPSVLDFVEDIKTLEQACMSQCIIKFAILKRKSNRDSEMVSCSKNKP